MSAFTVTPLSFTTFETVAQAGTRISSEKPTPLEAADAIVRRVVLLTAYGYPDSCAITIGRVVPGGVQVTFEAIKRLT